jgi:hypothetical protein
VEKLRDFLKVTSTLSQADFLEQFPHPLLFYSPVPGVIEEFGHTRLVEGGGGREEIDRFSEKVLQFEVLLPNARTGREFPRRIFIGRDPARDFVIPHSTVSARHASLIHLPEQDSWQLVDAGSTNGTFVRGRMLKPGQPALLRDGDVVTFGRQDFLFFSPRGAYRYLRHIGMFKEAIKKG